MSRGIKYDPLSFQDTFQRSTKPKVLLSSGYGGGKTYSLVMKLFQLCNANFGLPGGILCPSYRMYKKDVLPTIEEICTDNNIPYYYHKSEMYFYFYDTQSKVYVFSAENDGASIKGPNLAFMVINELMECSEIAYMRALARVRLKKASLPQVAGSGTPSLGWCYDYFVEDPRADTDLIFGKSSDNFHVGDFYIQNLRDSYDPEMQKVYIDGEYLNLKKKRCLYAFSRQKHVRSNIEKLIGFPVWISLDFNVNPMAATLWNRMPSILVGSDRSRTKQAELIAFDEIRIESSNTYEMCNAIREKTSDTDQIIIFPDPAGKSRSTKSRGVSDIDILEEAGFDDIRYKSKISVRDCLNATNNFLAKGRAEISNKCKNLIADCEQCTFKGDAFEIDKSNPKRTHWIDGFKNMVEYEFPIGKRPSFREERVR